MWLFLFLLLLCTQITYNHQKYSKIGEVTIGEALGPVFQVFRENETSEISENKQELISDAKSPGQIFIVNFIDKYAQNQLAKTQELTPRAEQTSKKSKIITKDGQMLYLLYMTFAASGVFNCCHTKGKSRRPSFHGSRKTPKNATAMHFAL